MASPRLTQQRVLAAIAEDAKQAFGPGTRMRVRASGVVHAVTLVPWLGGLQLPGPACMVGVAGWDPFATTAVDGDVTCGRCKHLRTPTVAADTDQLPLFLAV